MDSESSLSVLIPNFLESRLTVGHSNKVTIDIAQGTPPFDVLVNGIEVLQTNNTSFSIDAISGDLIEVKTNVACEGVFSKKMAAFEEISAYPNPTTGIVTLSLLIAKKEATIELYNMQSQLISSKTYPE